MHKRPLQFDLRLQELLPLGIEFAVLKPFEPLVAVSLQPFKLSIPFVNKETEKISLVFQQKIGKIAGACTGSIYPDIFQCCIAALEIELK